MTVIRSMILVVAVLANVHDHDAYGARRPRQELTQPLPPSERNNHLGQLERYFQQETQQIANRCLADVNTPTDWQVREPDYRRQLAEMLGLDPFPSRTELHPVVTGETTAPGIVVERLHFQSLPGLYVTANFFRPAEVTSPLPAILYLCGHARVQENGIDYGNKTAYHHHGVWFARHGYVCLILDTIQLGEIEGVHHGTYNLNQWWWNSRGYTPAGVEAWNGIRALDYLEQRPEVDSKRIGVTGRSGGGASTWWVAALDQRVAAAVPVAGITSLHNHVVDGCVDGHCDCMFPVNTYRWDFAQIAALVAPRPLLIANSDHDPIFPLEGVVDVYQKTRRIYRLLGAEQNLGLNITPGPHTDTQELQVPAFRWFDQHLKKSDRPIEAAALPVFSPPQLKVFEPLPKDERVTTVSEFFVPSIPDTPLPVAWFPASDPSSPVEGFSWEDMSAAGEMVEKQLRSKVFAGWPDSDQVPELNPIVINQASHDGVKFLHVEFNSQTSVSLPLFIWDWGTSQEVEPTRARFEVFHPGHSSLLQAWTNLASTKTADQLSAGDRELLAKQRELARRQSVRFQICVVPRGQGPAKWTDDPAKLTQIRRRFMLLGQTLAGMQVWDIRRAKQAFLQLYPNSVVSFQGEDAGAAAVMLAAIGDRDVSQVLLIDPPAHHRQAEDYLNLARIVEPRQLAGLLLAQGTDVTVVVDEPQLATWNEVVSATNRLSATTNGVDHQDRSPTGAIHVWPHPWVE
jgi:hypothetical protein